jgi:4-hydroxybenzoate polyprenyltransferase
MRLRSAIWELVRLPNLFTAASDILAGFLFGGGNATQWVGLVAMMAASMLLYAGGVSLNDVCDADDDAQTRPERPIPSGRISRRAALGVSSALLVAGVGLAFGTHREAAIPTGCLVAAILLYNTALKATPLAPAMMGICRAANLWLGVTMAGPVSWSIVVFPCAMMWLYVASITCFARHEAGESRIWQLRLGTLGAVAALGGLVCIPWKMPIPYLGFLVPLTVLIVGLLRLASKAIETRAPNDVQKAVQWFVISLIGFDVCLASASRGLSVGILPAAALIPTLWLKRRIRMT